MDAPVVRSEWEVIEAKLVTRHDATCPICMEGFNQGYEVLLSCSHIFHRSCLESFERFMGRDTRSCPICRKANYQKKITKCGTAAWEVQCITRIQAVLRGFLLRQRFYDVYYRGAPSEEGEGGRGTGLGAQLLRRRYLSQELTVLANARKKEVDKVVSGIDATLTENQELDQLFDQMLRTRQTYHEVAGVSEAERERELEQEALETDQRDLAMELATFDSGDGSDDGGRPRGSEEEEEEGQKVSMTAEQWQEVVQMARKRGLGQCSICLCDNKGLRGLSLLSCSHVFHSTCLLSFERFSRTRKVGQSLSSLYYKRFKSFQRLTVSYIFSFIYSCLSCDSLYSNAQAAPCVARPSAPPASPPILRFWVEARARKGLPSPARALVVSFLYACIHCSFCNSAVPVVRSLSLSLLLLIGGHRP
jgi:hypothetical protein